MGFQSPVNRMGYIRERVNQTDRQTEADRDGERAETGPLLFSMPLGRRNLALADCCCLLLFGGYGFSFGDLVYRGASLSSWLGALFSYLFLVVVVVVVSLSFSSSSFLEGWMGE